MYAICICICICLYATNLALGYKKAIKPTYYTPICRNLTGFTLPWLTTMAAADTRVPGYPSGTRVT